MPTFVGDSILAHAKAGCYRCQRGDNIVDLDVQIEGEGILALCRNCLLEAVEAIPDVHLNGAAVAEMRMQHAEERRRFSPEAVAELEQRLADTRLALEHEQRTVATLQDALTRVGKDRKPVAPRGKETVSP